MTGAKTEQILSQTGNSLAADGDLEVNSVRNWSDAAMKTTYFESVGEKGLEPLAQLEESGMSLQWSAILDQCWESQLVEPLLQRHSVEPIRSLILEEQMS